VEDHVDALDERSYLLSSDEISLNKLAIRIDVLLFPTEKIICTYNLMARLDK
jgi:hypothetical protein